MDGAQIGVLKQVDDKVLGRLGRGGWEVCVCEREREKRGAACGSFSLSPSLFMSPHLLQGQQGLRRPPEGFGGDPVGDLAGLGEWEKQKKQSV